MPARTCAECKLSFPVSYLQCPICHGPSKYDVAQKEDSDWKARVDSVAESFTSEALIRVVKGVIPIDKDDAGRLWVSQLELTRQGLAYSYLHSFDLVEIDGALFELQGYHPSKRRWWIEKMAVPAAAPLV